MLLVIQFKLLFWAPQVFAIEKTYFPFYSQLTHTPLNSKGLLFHIQPDSDSHGFLSLPEIFDQNGKLIKSQKILIMKEGSSFQILPFSSELILPETFFIESLKLSFPASNPASHVQVFAKDQLIYEYQALDSEKIRSFHIIPTHFRSIDHLRIIYNSKSNFDLSYRYLDQLVIQAHLEIKHSHSLFRGSESSPKIHHDILYSQHPNLASISWEEDKQLNPSYLADYDDDGVNNIDDNCPTKSNSDQRNADSDRFGDECDPEPFYPWNFIDKTIAFP